MMEVLRGRVWKFSDNVDTDVIYPGRYLKYFLSPEEMARHVMEGASPEFARSVKPGDIIVGGRNFGCGSSREEAVVSLKAAKVGGLIAESFARIFFRNAINVGLPLMECRGIGGKVQQGDLAEVDLVRGEIKNLSTSELIKGTPLPDFLQEILKKGGLIPYIKDKVLSE